MTSCQFYNRDGGQTRFSRRRVRLVAEKPTLRSTDLHKWRPKKLDSYPGKHGGSVWVMGIHSSRTLIQIGCYT